MSIKPEPARTQTRQSTDEVIARINKALEVETIPEERAYLERCRQYWLNRDLLLERYWE